ncbi:MAG: DUF72 domain-containing protein [Candidatus Ratteibacteria bacterium]
MHYNQKIIWILFKIFNTVEVNSSFYHFSRQTSYKNWYKHTPVGFVFSVKVHRSSSTVVMGSRY